jgi:hypothetical protein
MSVVINGSAGVTTNSGAVYNGIQAGTAVASTSGTSIDFTGIPSWVKRITVMLNGVSTSGTSLLQVQLGDSGGIETTGYTSGGWINNTTTNTSTTGFLANASTAAANIQYGIMTIALVSGNVWIASCSSGFSGGGGSVTGGTKTLSDTLTQVRITTVNGTDTFDAGSINILYE